MIVNHLKTKVFLKDIFGKLFAYQTIFLKTCKKTLFFEGIELMTSIRNNMKNCLMLMSDKILLLKRYVIEKVNDELKNIC